MQFLHLIKVHIDTPTIQESPIHDIVDGVAGDGTFSHTRKAYNSDESIFYRRVFREKLFYKRLANIHIANQLIHTRRFVPQNRLFFLTCDFSMLEIAKNMTTFPLRMLFTHKKLKMGGFFYAIWHFHRIYSGLKSLANLWFRTPRAVIKSSSEGKHGAICDSRVFINSDDVFCTCLLKYLRSELRMTIGHKHKIQFNPRLLHHLTQLIRKQILPQTLIILHQQCITLPINLLHFPLRHHRITLIPLILFFYLFGGHAMPRKMNNSRSFLIQDFSEIFHSAVDLVQG